MVGHGLSPKNVKRAHSLGTCTQPLSAAMEYRWAGQKISKQEMPLPKWCLPDFFHNHRLGQAQRSRERKRPSKRACRLSLMALTPRHPGTHINK
eukprot:1161447-Pelagomonas_calceolata.AAC.7